MFVPENAQPNSVTDQFPDPDGLNGEDLPTCPECGAALVLVVASVLPDALGMDLTVERRE